MIDKRLVMRGLTCDPCVCGDTDTWHPSCYQGLSQEQINAKMKDVMTKLRRKHLANAMNITNTLIKLVKI